MGAPNRKKLLLNQITFESFQTFFLNFLLDGPHKIIVLDFCNFEFPIFNEFFNINRCSLWGNEKKTLSGQLATVERNGVKFESQG